MGDSMTGISFDTVDTQLELLAEADAEGIYVQLADEQLQTLQGQRDEIDGRLAQVSNSRAGLQAKIDTARAEAYAWVLDHHSDVPPSHLCWLAARAAVLGRRLEAGDMIDVRSSALAIGRLGVGDSVLTVSGDRVSGLVARSRVGFEAHPTGLAVTFLASPSDTKASKKVTTPVNELFGRSDSGKASPGRDIFIGRNAIQEAVSEVLAQPAGPGRPSASSLIMALHRAGLTLNGLGVEPHLVDAARDDIYRVATEPRAYKHNSHTKQQEGYTDVVDAEAWAAALLVEQPVGANEETLQTHRLAVADQLEAMFLVRLQENGGSSPSRIKTVVGRLAQIRANGETVDRTTIQARVEELGKLAGL